MIVMRKKKKSLSSNARPTPESVFSEYHLLPHAEWVPDNKAAHCFNCNKSFIPLVRSKHHCRRCGNVFCKSCSKWFLLSSEIGINEKEKKYRFCEYCYQGYKNFMKLKNTQINKAEEWKQHRNYHLKEKEDNFSIKHRVFFAETINIPYLQETHNEIVAKNIDGIITFIFQKKKIYDKWFSLLKNLLDQAMKNIFLVPANKNEFLDHNKIIKIKKIPFQDHSLTKWVNGVVCRKNISDKKMKNFMLSPRIFIATQIDLMEDNDLAVFDNLIQNEAKQIKKIIKKIMKLKPNIIIVEKSINRIAYEYFKGAEIIVIIKVKHDLLKRIARVTKAKIIKDLNRLDKLPEEKILGTCEKFHIKKYFVEDFSSNKSGKNYDKISLDSEFSINNSDPFYLFIEVLNPFRGSTIIISGPNDEELTEVKEAMKMSIKLARNCILEKEIVTNEMLLLHQINIENLRTQQPHTIKKSESFGSMIEDNLNENNKNFYKREGDFSKYLFNKMSFEEIFNNQSIQYTKIWFVKGFLENCNEICANEEAVKYFYEKYGIKEPQNIFDFFVEICELPACVKIDYYSEDDLTLGQYLVLRVNNLNSKCQTCKRPRYQHAVVYYYNKAFVKISCELTGMSQYQTFNIEEQLIKQSSDSGFKEMCNEHSIKDYTPSKSIYSKEKDDKSPLQKAFPIVQNVRKATSVSLSKFEIKVYIECNICGAILTQEKHVSSNYLEYSFTRYLLHFFLNNEPNNEKNNEMSVREIEEKNKTCKHKYKNRVFNYNGTLIKFNSGLCNFYHLEKIKDVMIKSRNENELIKNNIILLKKEELKAKIKSFTNEIVKILENSSDSVKTQLGTAEKKNLLQNMPSNQIHLMDDWKTAIEFQTIANTANENESLEIMDEDDEGEEYYQFFENPQINTNYLESSQDIANYNLDDTSSSKGLASIDFQKIDPIECQDLTFDDFNHIQKALADKIVSERKNISRKFKKEFVNSHQYSELINKAKCNIVPFLELIKTKIIDLTNNFINSCNHKSIKSYIEIEDLRFKFIRKICQLLNLIQFLSSKKRKKLKNINENDLKSIENRRKFIDTMKSSMQITQENEDVSNEDEKQGSEDEKFNNEQSPQNLTKILEESPFKALNYTHLFRNMYNEMNKGQAFIDMQDAKDYRKMQKYKAISVNEDEPLTLIAFTLNSCQYMKDVYMKAEFHEIEKKIFVKEEKEPKKTQETYNFFKRILEETDLTEKNSIFSLKCLIKTNPKTNIFARKDLQNLDANSTDFEETLNFKKLKSKFSFEKAKVTVYYPAFFEAMRMAYGIDLSSFIQSLGLNNQWKENSGGKSKAKFIKTYDEIFLIKQLQKNEFFMIQSYAKHFFSYMWSVLNGKNESIMTKIFGLFEVYVNNNTYYYMVMENLFYMLKNENLLIYDLKGSEKNRFAKKNRLGQTLLDTNFKIERNNEPLALLEKDYQFFKKACENDTNFLSEHNLIDYSLLIIIDENSSKIRMGIIDFLRIYTWDKQLEHMGKIVINAGVIPTITNPNDYKERFINALKKFFFSVKIL